MALFATFLLMGNNLGQLFNLRNRQNLWIYIFCGIFSAYSILI